MNDCASHCFIRYKSVTGQKSREESNTLLLKQKMLIFLLNVFYKGADLANGLEEKRCGGDYNTQISYFQ